MFDEEVKGQGASGLPEGVGTAWQTGIRALDVLGCRKRDKKACRCCLQNSFRCHPCQMFPASEQLWETAV